jgi:hypothetical protein
MLYPQTKGRGENLHGPETKKPWGFWSAHGLVCRFEFSGHSARAGQTPAKKIIKAKISAGVKAEHRVHSFQAQNFWKNTRSPFPCQAFSVEALVSSL